MSRIRFLPTFIVGIVTLMLLTGGWFAYRSYVLVAPLTTQLRSVPNVENATITVSSGQREVIVRVGPVKDLQTTYGQVDKVVRDTLGSDAQITLADNRSAALVQIYRSIQPIIFEAVADGKFTTMFDSINHGKYSDASVHVSMNESYIYLQLEQGKHDLYQIIPYHTPMQEVSPS